MLCALNIVRVLNVEGPAASCIIGVAMALILASKLLSADFTPVVLKTHDFGYISGFAPWFRVLLRAFGKSSSEGGSSS